MRNPVFPAVCLLISVALPLQAVFACGTTAFSEWPGAAAPPVPPPSPSLTSVHFPIDTYLVPMDEKQADMVKAFGLAHAILRNGSFIFRIIAPPDVNITTADFPTGATYAGGPILIMDTDTPVVNSVRANFTSVTVHRVSEAFTSDSVFVVKRPTSILVSAMAGHTEDLLAEMGIPHDICTTNQIKAYPEMVNNYSLFVDDCLGIADGDLYKTPKVAPAFRNFTAAGNELIFTCWALRDMKETFPEYVDGVINMAERERESNISAYPDFPAQYWGPEKVTFKAVWSNATPKLPNVTTIARGNEWHDAMYFYFGKGIAEFFSFHPGEQTGDARKASIILYGNKFLHLSPPDWGVSLTAIRAPAAIAKKGTGNPPSLEQCQVTLKAETTNIYITFAHGMKMNFGLRPYVDYVNGTFYDMNGLPRPPDSITVHPNASKVLSWNLYTLPNGGQWRISFNITSDLAGPSVPINEKYSSNVTFHDDDGNNVVRPFVELKVQVNEVPDVAGPVIWAAALAAVFLAVIAAVSSARRRKRLK